MAIYKYSNQVESTEGYFTNFSEIKPYLKSGDRIIFASGYGTGINWQSDLRCVPYYSIGSSTTFNDISNKVFNLSGLKVKIIMNKSTALEGRFNYWKNVNSHITLNCLKLEESKSNFLIGYLRTYLQSNVVMNNDNETSSTNCLNIISIPENKSLQGLEDRRIFVIPSYGYVDSSLEYSTTYFDDTRNVLYGKRQSKSYTDPQTSGIWTLVGGAGFYGGKAFNKNEVNSGTPFLLTNSVEKPSTYMSDWQTYANIIDGNIEILSSTEPISGDISFEMQILSTSNDKSIFKYYDGSTLINTNPYYYDGTNLKLCDAYYFDGNKLIKL